MIEAMLNKWIGRFDVIAACYDRKAVEDGVSKEVGVPCHLISPDLLPWGKHSGYTITR